MRTETRKERYKKKLKKAVKIPLSIATVNFIFDDNLAFIIRTATCFGIDNIYVIGSAPPKKVLRAKSGSMQEFCNLLFFKNPTSFLKFARDNNFNIISAEINPKAKSLYEYKFDFNNHTCLVLGNELTGVPAELILNSKLVYIPMNGAGFCLNTSQTGTAIVSEYCRQYFRGQV